MDSLSLVHVLIISTCIHAVIFIFLVLSKKENKKANYFLAALILSLAFTLFTSLVLDLHWYDRYPALHLLPFSLTFAIGPSFYFYIKFLTDPSQKFRKKQLWHFAPIILNYCHSIYHLILGRGVPYPELHNFTEALEIYALIPMLIYAWMAFKDVIGYQKNVLLQLSMVDNVMLKWIKQIRWIILVSLIPSTIYVIVDYQILIDFNREFSQGTLFSNDTVLHLANAIVLYWISIGGFRQSQIEINQGLAKSISASIDAPPNLKDHTAAVAKLTNAMDHDKLYLNPTLNLKELEEHLKIDAKDISLALNKGLGQNFYTLVNNYRIEEVKQRMVSKEYDHLSILGIALDSGFNSKATFNRIFKEQTGLSPKEYKAKNST